MIVAIKLEDNTSATMVWDSCGFITKDGLSLGLGLLGQAYTSTFGLYDFDTKTDWWFSEFSSNYTFQSAKLKTKTKASAFVLQ